MITAPRGATVQWRVVQKLVVRWLWYLYNISITVNQAMSYSQKTFNLLLIIFHSYYCLTFDLFKSKTPLFQITSFYKANKNPNVLLSHYDPS